MATQIEPQEQIVRAPFGDSIPWDTFVQAIYDQQNNVVPAQPSLEELAIQMADWVDENVGGLSQREAEGIEAEFKRLVALAPPHHDAP